MSSSAPAGRSPERGPKLLFFSGGSALRETSRVLTEYTHRSIHLITPFDSGGSSAVLRRAFSMIAVGDLRNRLMALADTATRGHPQVYRLFDHRFPSDTPNDELRARLNQMAAGTEPSIRAVPEPLRRAIEGHLRHLCDVAPSSLDLRGASVGNLVIVGAYLHRGRDIDAALSEYAELVQVRGRVRPVVTDDLHLVAELEDGRSLVGQHAITGRVTPQIESPIRELRLSSTSEIETPARARIDAVTRDSIVSADLIVFPIGSFFTSVMACLLPDGVAEAVREARCPKVYVPNPGHDPEQLGCGPAECVQRLQARLMAGADTSARSPDRVLDIVLVDSRHGRYQPGIDPNALRESGVRVVDTSLVGDPASSRVDPRRLTEALLSLT